MTPNEAERRMPAASRFCKQRGHHRESDRTPGECGDCGVDIPLPEQQGPR